MRVVVQRVTSASVKFLDKENKINKGLVLLVGFTKDDTLEDVDYLINKIIHLRIFDDENGVMNKSVIDICGEILSISQFTLYGDCKKGNRPNYSLAMSGNEAIKLYDYFNNQLEKLIPIQIGGFGEEMLVNINNEGPVTIILESRKKNENKLFVN